VSYVRRRVGEAQPVAAWGYELMPGGERLAKMDLLTGRTVWSMSDGADAVSDYVTTPGNPVWRLERSYGNGLVIDSKVARIEPDGRRFFYVTDALGSATGLVDDAQGIANRYFTTAWGEDLIDERAVPDRYGFTQRERDEESGLVHFRARSYDPRLGRFTQNDSILGNRPSEHYVYAGNNPVSRVDPMGDRWRIKPGPGTETMLRDLAKYTGRKIKVDAGGTVWFTDEWGKQYASQADMDWIWKVQNDNSDTDITGLWTHLVNGDAWHRKRFAEAWIATTIGEYSPVSEAAKQGNTWGIYQAPAEYQNDPAFVASIWLWRTAQVALAVATAGASLKANAAVTGTVATTGGTVAASSAGQEAVRRLPEVLTKPITQEVLAQLAPQLQAQWPAMIQRMQQTGQAVGMATPRFGILVELFKGSPEKFRLIVSMASQATAKAYRGGISLEEIYEVIETGERFVRHIIYSPTGQVVHETFRTYAKGGP